MTMRISTGNMIKRISGLVGTNDVTMWEEDFIVSICERTDTGVKDIELLSDKQLYVIEKLYTEHFAG